MPDTEIALNAEVRFQDGPYGRYICVVFDPVRTKVTHVVIRENEMPQSRRLIPIEFAEVITPGQINLTCTRDQLSAMEAFIETELILADARLPWVMLWPFVEPVPGLVVLEHEKLPAGEVALRPGVPVYASDGFIGDVGELMIDRANGEITHLVLREGHLWGQKDVSIPVPMIRNMDQGRIQLGLSRKEVETLPAIPISRPRM